MAKKKSLNSEKIRSKKLKQKPVNPFELKVIKSKRDTLNTKIRKHQISKPGQSRVRNRQIQDQTIGIEWNKRNRKNVFHDGRIDTKKMNEEDFEKVAVEKFAIEARKRASNRMFDSGIGEVADEEVLTHRGKSLADMERFDDPDVSDDENDRNPGHLNEEQTEALFGGGVLKKKDHKEIMLDVIAKSKKFKYERQKEKEQLVNEFEKFDEEFKTIRNLTRNFDRTADQKYDDRKVERQDDFSRIMREMRFEARVQPGKKLKSQEELDKEAEEERFNKVQEMKSRMQEDESDDEGKTDSVERILEKKPEVKDVAPLAYDMESGTLLNHREELSEALRNIRKCDSDGEEIEEDSNGEEETDDDDDNEEESGEENDEEANDGEILDPTPEFDSDGEACEENESESDLDEEPQPKKKKPNPLTIDEEKVENEVELLEPKLKKQRKMLEPILTQVSEKGDMILSSYKKFRATLVKLIDNSERLSLVSSLCKKIVTGTDKDRQAKLRSLFQFTVLSFMRNDFYDSDGKSIAPILYTICEKCQMSGSTVLAILRDFSDESISIEFIRFFKIVISLYSVSDFNNTIGLPAQIIAVRMISKIRARNLEDISLGLYLCSLLLKSVETSGRYIPEVFIFLLSVISLAFEVDERPRRIFPSFKLSKLTFDVDQEEKLSLSTPTSNGIIFSAIRIVQECTKSKFNFAASNEIYEDFTIISELPIDDKIKSVVLDDLKRAMGGSRKTLSRKKKVKMLPLYEPKIEEEGYRKQSKKERDLKNLSNQVKKAKREATKRIREDQKYIQEKKFKIQEEKDSRRKEAVKRIHGQLANQEGEVKKVKHKKYNLFPDL